MNKGTLFWDPFLPSLTDVRLSVTLRTETSNSLAFGLYDKLWLRVPQSHFALRGETALSRLPTGCLPQNYLVFALVWAPELEFCMLVTNPGDFPAGWSWGAQRIRRKWEMEKLIKEQSCCNLGLERPWCAGRVVCGPDILLIIQGSRAGVLTRAKILTLTGMLPWVRAAASALGLFFFFFSPCCILPCLNLFANRLESRVHKVS